MPISLPIKFMKWLFRLSQRYSALLTSLNPPQDGTKLIDSLWMRLIDILSNLCQIAKVEFQLIYPWQILQPSTSLRKCWESTILAHICPSDLKIARSPSFPLEEYLSNSEILFFPKLSRKKVSWPSQQRRQMRLKGLWVNLLSTKFWKIAWSMLIKWNLLKNWLRSCKRARKNQKRSNLQRNKKWRKRAKWSPTKI